MKNKNEMPYCFGKLEKVFPMGEDELRYTPEVCTFCLRKVECLKKAGSKGKGWLKLKSETIDRAYESGQMRFFERWSQKKTLHKIEKQKKS